MRRKMQEEEASTTLLPKAQPGPSHRRLGIITGGVGLVVLFVSAALLAFIGSALSPWVVVVPLAIALALILIGYYLVR